LIERPASVRWPFSVNHHLPVAASNTDPFDRRIITMPAEEGTRSITIVTACMNADGTPDFALTTVDATEEQIENGIHYYFAEAELLEAGYEEPFVHFDEHEAPAFLHPAVQQYLNQALPITEPVPLTHSEEH
jgi:hypothetical protein